MKCSLLTLSTFIDGELAPQRTAEVDAHLVGCTRCSAGAATLREEKSRIGQLARVSVDPASAQLMLEQVGIAVDAFADLPPAMSPPQVAPVDEHRPWQGGTSSPALPWTPRRPEAPAIPGDLQAELPLEGVRAVPASWNRVDDIPVTPPSAAAAMVPPSPPAADPAPVTGLDAAAEGWLSGAATPDGWEAELPPAADVPPPVNVDAWNALPPPDAVAPPAGLTATPAESPGTAPPPPPPVMPAHAGPPTRVVAASGPAALWARIHDAVSVRLALARSGEALEDSAHIVSGAPARRGAQPPSSPELRRSAPVEPLHDAVASADASDEVELSGVVGAPRAPFSPASQAPEASEPADWNAFAGSSYPDVDAPAEPEREPRARPLGRHSRAVAREQVPLSTRLNRSLAVAAAAVRAGATTASAQVRAGVGRMSRGGPDNRLLAGIAGIGLIFVVALLIGRSPSHPSTPATRAASTTAPQAQQSAPQPSAAASSAGAVAPAQVQTFGAGDTGFQVIRLRYGVQKTYLRVVFDMGAAGAAAAGTPKVTLSFSTPTTLLVTIDGTLPAGSAGTPPPGKVISSVTLVSSTGHKTVYRFALTRPATATAFYLTAPTRFVLDIH